VGEGSELLRSIRCYDPDGDRGSCTVEAHKGGIRITCGDPAVEVVWLFDLHGEVITEFRVAFDEARERVKSDIAQRGEEIK
jgi:hypothetical protein